MRRHHDREPRTGAPAVPAVLKWVGRVRTTLLWVSAAALLASFGARSQADDPTRRLPWVFPLLALGGAAIAVVRRRLAPDGGGLQSEHTLPLGIAALTVAGAAATAVAPPAACEVVYGTDVTGEALTAWWHVATALWLLCALPDALRSVSIARTNPAVVVTVSFASAVGLGTVLLMMPRAAAGDRSADVLTAFFTSTSATCVTGLVVVPTDSYWSHFGHWVILCLMQFGGMGIMTFGAFMAVATGRGLMMREAALLGDMLDKAVLRDVRRAVLGVVLITLGTEAVGAVLLSGMFADLPPAERAFHSAFHAVSAFCNAGFTTRPGGLEGLESRIEVWGVLCLLVIAGGIGFGTLTNLWAVARHRLFPPARDPARAPIEPPRLNLTTRLVLITTGLLLAVGPVGVMLLELVAGSREMSPADRIADAWCISVNGRTAGINTSPVDGYCEATRFWIILLMFVGGSPGSTAGGVKTVAAAVSVMAFASLIRGRGRVEIAGRTVPEDLARRALLIVALATLTVMVGTLALTITERSRLSGRFLDLLFECVSALMTVGLTSDVTPHLSDPGRVLVSLMMFVGRVGPLTLMLALAGPGAGERYRYPEERVALG